MHAFAVVSAVPRSGKTLLAAAIARSLHLDGFDVAPLHLAPQVPQRFACPSGGTVSRAAAILAEACGIPPEPRFEAASPDEFGDFDWLIIESPNALPGIPFIDIRRGGAGFRVDAPASSFEIPEPSPIDLMPIAEPAVDALPAYGPGAPRVGILSLPYSDNFHDFRLIRGAEWIAFPLPGRLDLILVPASTNWNSDREWLSLQGLDEWLHLQRAMGCRLLTTASTPIPGVPPVYEAGSLSDFRILSLLLGARIAAPLPTDDEFDALAEWWNRHAPAPLARLLGPA